MKIKRFTATDMRTALRMVRDEQGPEAVILSNRSIAGGVEVVAATDYDEGLAREALRSILPPRPTTALDRPAEAVVFDIGLPETLARAMRGTPAATEPARFEASPRRETVTAPPVESRPAAATDFMSPDPVPTKASPVTPAASAAPGGPRPVRISPWDEDPSLSEVRNELVTMREMIEREMQRLTDERLHANPARGAALDSLIGYGCEEVLARDIAQRIPTDADPARARGLMLVQLAKQIPIVQRDPLRAPGVVALVGPTGAGKTTTVAKLAARYAQEHGPRNVALLTTDTHRPGGREQLQAYGREFGLTVLEASSEPALMQALARLSDYPLVLIDTAGHGQRDRAMVGQLNWLRHAGRVRTLLVMPANSHNADMDEVVRRFSFISPEAAILTKLDETGRLGGALSVLSRHGLPLAYTTDGQVVPDDLANADASKLVLRLEELRRAGERLPVQEGGDVAA